MHYPVLLSLCLWLTQAAPVAAAAHDDAPVLHIATSLSQSDLSGRIELRLQQAYQQLGYRIHLVRLPAGRSLQMTNQGLYDGELFRIDGLQQQYPQLRQVPVRLANIELLAYVRRAHAAKLQNWPQQPGLRIGYVRGFRLAEQVRYAGKALPVTTLEQAVGMLRQGKIDVLLEDQLSVLSQLPEGLTQAGIAAQPDILAQAGLYHYLHQRHQALLPPLTAALKKSVAPGPVKPAPQQ